MENPNQTPEVQVFAVTLARCEDNAPCVGCGRPTHTAVVDNEGQHRAHVCSPMCFTLVELASRIVEAAQQGVNAPHMQAAPIPHPKRKEDLN
jgi:hypothetical protein